LFHRKKHSNWWTRSLSLKKRSW